MDTLTNVREAVQKLCAFLQRSEGSEAQQGVEDDVAHLFAPRREDSVRDVDVELAFMLAPTAHRVPLYFVVPNEVLHGSICLITPPPQRAFKDRLLALNEKGDTVAKRVKRVIDTTKLNAKFIDPVAVRAFARGYDNFVVYGVHRYPRQLSGEFIGHARLPVWVAKKGALDEKLRQAVRTVVVSRRGQNAVTCRVGHTGLSVEQLEQNVRSFVEKFTHHPQGVPMAHILHIRVAGTDGGGRRAGLPIFGHHFEFVTTDAALPAEAAKTGEQKAS